MVPLRVRFGLSTPCFSLFASVLVVAAIGLLGGATASARSANDSPVVRAQPPDPDSDQSAAEGGGGSATDLAKQIQNPVGDLISVPFQNNIKFRSGPRKGTQHILNMQPDIPIHVTQTGTSFPAPFCRWSGQVAASPKVPVGAAPDLSRRSCRSKMLSTGGSGVSALSSRSQRSAARLRLKRLGRWSDRCRSQLTARGSPARWSTTCFHLGAQRVRAAQNITHFFCSRS